MGFVKGKGRNLVLFQLRRLNWMDRCVIGVDFGSDSVRAVVVNTVSGKVLASAVSMYPRWSEGKYQHPETAVFRQHPLDYIESFTACVSEAVKMAGPGTADKIAGIGIDTTGSTPVAVNREGTPLSLTDTFSENENAMFLLWKDHSAAREAEELTGLFHTAGSRDYLTYMGTYSAEWYWAKILHVVRTDQAVRDAAYTWVEHCDWMVGLLTGNTHPETMYHSACAAGFKALWNSEWNGLPDKEVLGKADEYLKKVAERFGSAPKPATVSAGRILPEWAARLGVPENTEISGSSFDAHAGAIGGGVGENILVCTLGTSAVDMTVVRPDELRNINVKMLTRFGGLAEDSILPGYVGIETGQAAFGDIFAWFRRLLSWPLQRLEEEPDGTPQEREMCFRMEERILPMLQREAEHLEHTETLPVALDWINGRRYPNANDAARGVLADISLGTNAPQVYWALVFSAVSGLNRIREGFEQSGIRIDKVKAVGGIPRKSSFIMQMMADLMEKPIEILDENQTCALGAAIYAAMGSGCCQSLNEAVSNMSARVEKCYRPDADRHTALRRQYARYLALAKERQ